MPTPVDYIAAATSVAEGTPAPEAPVEVEPVAPVAVPAPPSGEAEAPIEVPDAGAAPEVKADPPAEKPSSRVEKGYEDLAREKAALRKEKEAIQQEAAELKAYREAARGGDALALLAAAKIPWRRAAEQVLATNEAPAQKAASKAEPDERDRRLAALEQEIASTKAQAARQNLMGQLKELTKDKRFAHVSHMEAEGQVISYIEKYFNETGELPGSNLQETMEIAAEAVETQLAKEAARWEGVLTKLRPGAVVPVSKSVVPAVGAVSQQAKTLTNSAGSGPKSTPVTPHKPKTDEEYQLAAIQALTAP